MNDETRCRSAARHAAYRSSSAAAPTSVATPGLCGARNASATTSESVATSRSARLKPCPATGCRRRAASPISTARSPWMAPLATRASVYRWRSPTRVKRPSRWPNAACSSARNASAGERRDALGVAFGQRPDHRRAAARERQQRDRTARREALERAAFERRLGAAVEDHGALPVVVLAGLDAERGRAPPSARRRPRRRAWRARSRAASRCRTVTTACSAPRATSVTVAGASTVNRSARCKPLPEHAAEHLVLDRVAERRHVLFGRA